MSKKLLVTVASIGAVAVLAAPRAAQAQGAAANLAASKFADALIAMAKSVKYAGLASGRANDQVDGDDDSISRFLAWSGLETQINLDIRSDGSGPLKDQKASAFVNVDYSIEFTPQAGVRAKAFFLNKELDATAGKPGKGDDDPQFASASWGIAVDGSAVFGPYHKEAGRDPNVPKAQSQSALNVNPFVVDPADRVWVLPFSALPPISGEMTLHSTLTVIDQTATQVRFAPAINDPALATTAHRVGGYLLDTPDGVEPFPDPATFADLLPGAAYQTLFDVGFTQTAPSVWVDRLAPDGHVRTDDELLAAAAAALYAFGVGNAAGSSSLTTTVGSGGQVDILAAYSAPFTDPFWSSDLAFYAPNEDYWQPLIAAGQATLQQAWDEVMAQLEGEGIPLRTLNFRDAFGEFDDATAAGSPTTTPEPSTLALTILGLGAIAWRRRSVRPGRRGAVPAMRAERRA